MLALNADGRVAVVSPAKDVVYDPQGDLGRPSDGYSRAAQRSSLLELRTGERTRGPRTASGSVLNHVILNDSATKLAYGVQTTNPATGRTRDRYYRCDVRTHSSKAVGSRDYWPDSEGPAASADGAAIILRTWDGRTSGGLALTLFRAGQAAREILPDQSTSRSAAIDPGARTIALSCQSGNKSSLNVLDLASGQWGQVATIAGEMTELRLTQSGTVIYRGFDANGGVWQLSTAGATPIGTQPPADCLRPARPAR